MPLVVLVYPIAAAKYVLLGVTLTTIPLAVEDATASTSSSYGVGPPSTAIILSAEDTDRGMSSVSDSKLKLGAASTGDKGKCVRETCKKRTPLLRRIFHNKVQGTNAYHPLQS